MDKFANQLSEVFKRFLEEYYDSFQDDEGAMDVDEDDASSSATKPRNKTSAPSKYAQEALLLLQNERNTMFIDFKDLELYDSNLANDITTEYYRFYPYICRAVAAYVREERIRQAEALIDLNANVAQITAEREQIKRDLDRPQIKNKDYYVGFYNFPHRQNIRDLSSTNIGGLTRVNGQVVRTHSVHPELIIGCFRCKDCLSEQLTEQQFRYTQPSFCSNDNCENRSRFELILEKSRFTDFQRLRIQETQQELPRGCIPRSFDVIIRGADQVECIQPGDQCDFIGTLIAIPDVGQMMNGTLGTVSSEMSSESGFVGLKSMGVKEMVYSTAFLASSCILEGHSKPCSNTDDYIRDGQADCQLSIDAFTQEEIIKIRKMTEDPNILDNLSQSLFSSVYGSDNVKRGVFLQLLGGVSKQTPTGTKLRGDINICLVGDPSTAKSQFLKIVTDFAPFKAVYASGKASSASGLTAAVVRDTDGGFVIEAGALMLADRGICCIDEFDKMELKDQVAIHEAMEQQTISLTKAGVTATLNARASILAAANPVGGNYNPQRDLRSNVNFSLPIMSRFDLFFVIMDPQQEQNDRAIAGRILEMHRNYANSVNNQQEMHYSFDEIKLYLRFARKFSPKIPQKLEQIFVKHYCELRRNSDVANKSWRITVRQLESLVRLSEAIARAHGKDIVEERYVEIARKLIETTIVFVGDPEVELGSANEAIQGGDEETGATQGMYEGEVESQRLDPSQADPSSQPIKIGRPLYNQMTEILMIQLRREQERGNFAVKRMDLIEWYLHQCVGEISDEADLAKKKILCERVLDRLVKVDHKLLEITDNGQLIDPSGDGQQDDLPEPNERLITINPNMEIPNSFIE